MLAGGGNNKSLEVRNFFRRNMRGGQGPTPKKGLWLLEKWIEGEDTGRVTSLRPSVSFAVLCGPTTAKKKSPGQKKKKKKNGNRGIGKASLPAKGCSGI